jgi:hypothetical protein
MNKDHPDFDDLVKQIESISDLSQRVVILDTKIKGHEADIVRRVTTDSQFFQNGKSPSMDYIKSTWKYTGFNNELIPMRLELGKLESNLEKAKLTFQALRDFITLYVTKSANERKSLL